MRTTVAIDDDLLEVVKQEARHIGLTLGAYLEQALREKVLRPRPTDFPTITPLHGRGGIRPGVDPASNASLDGEDLPDDHGLFHV